MMVPPRAAVIVPLKVAPAPCARSGAENTSHTAASPKTNLIKFDFIEDPPGRRLQHVDHRKKVLHGYCTECEHPSTSFLIRESENQPTVNQCTRHPPRLAPIEGQYP